nr:MAG TPA: hypothetical protein [Bacteriophage sp.]
MQTKLRHIRICRISTIIISGVMEFSETKRIMILERLKDRLLSNLTLTMPRAM